MPAIWTTVEQREWLRQCLPDFLEAQKTGKTIGFTDRRGSLVQKLQFSRALGKRKKQLVTWFLWNSKAARRSTASSGHNIFEASEKDKLVRVPPPSTRTSTLQEEDPSRNNQGLGRRRRDLQD
ncbi:hypothetical protein Hypma_011227 [Hypsizygus marmoreus]|uniref:Uncharacterized protein n=1 Tax=Hypsizygus marmoreus TaxID=39966 RepID=A0A369JQH8_HYPMA|nr:hypothetical protein Hypma_011227 [Hypsizygus marmoreus]